MSWLFSSNDKQTQVRDTVQRLSQQHKFELIPTLLNGEIFDPVTKSQLKSNLNKTICDFLYYHPDLSGVNNKITQHFTNSEKAEEQAKSKLDQMGSNTVDQIKALYGDNVLALNQQNELTELLENSLRMFLQSLDEGQISQIIRHIDANDQARQKDEAEKLRLSVVKAQEHQDLTMNYKLNQELLKQTSHDLEMSRSQLEKKISELKVNKLKLLSMEQDLTTNKTQLDIVKSQLSATQSQLDMTESQLNKLNVDTDKIREQLHNADATVEFLSSAKKGLEIALKKEREDLLQQVKSLKESHETQRLDLKSKIQTYQSLIDQEKTFYQIMDADWHKQVSVMKHAHEMELKNLQDRLIHNQTDYEMLASKNDKLEVDASFMKYNFELLEQQNMALEQRNIELDQQKMKMGKDLSQKNDKLTAQIDNLQYEAEQSEEKFKLETEGLKQRFQWALESSVEDLTNMDKAYIHNQNKLHQLQEDFASTLTELNHVKSLLDSKSTETNLSQDSLSRIHRSQTLCATRKSSLRPNWALRFMMRANNLLTKENHSEFLNQLESFTESYISNMNEGQFEHLIDKMCQDKYLVNYRIQIRNELRQLKQQAMVTQNIPILEELFNPPAKRVAVSPLVIPDSLIKYLDRINHDKRKTVEDNHLLKLEPDTVIDTKNSIPTKPNDIFETRNSVSEIKNSVTETRNSVSESKIDTHEYFYKGNSPYASYDHSNNHWWFMTPDFILITGKLNMIHDFYRSFIAPDLEKWLKQVTKTNKVNYLFSTLKSDIEVTDFDSDEELHED